MINSETAEHVTYHELDQYSNQLAQLLLARGLRRGDHIAVFMENQVAYFVVGWAAMRSGLYVTPINRYLTTEETAYILNDCGAKAIITSRGIAASDDLGNEVPNCSIRLSVGGGHTSYEDFEEAVSRFTTKPLAEQPVGAMMPL